MIFPNKKAKSSNPKANGTKAVSRLTLRLTQGDTAIMDLNRLRKTSFLALDRILQNNPENTGRGPVPSDKRKRRTRF